MIATYLTHSQDCDLMVKCSSNTFDVKQVEKYVLQQSNSNEYTELCRLDRKSCQVENAFQFTQGSALHSFIVGRILR